MTGCPEPERPEARAITAAAPLGPFFGVAARPGPDWSSWAALCAGPEPLERRMERVRTVLARGPGNPVVAPAVVASLTHLGLVARLVAPLLGGALLTGRLPVAPVDRVHVRLAAVDPLPLAVEGTAEVPVGDAPELAATFGRSWLLPAVEPLTAVVRASGRISPRVLHGNVASAVAGALRMTARARPDLGAPADAALDAFLSAGPLAGTGSRRDDGSFVRRSCCLFYRLPGAGFCGDCILGDRPALVPRAGRV